MKIKALTILFPAAFIFVFLFLKGVPAATVRLAPITPNASSSSTEDRLDRLAVTLEGLQLTFEEQTKQNLAKMEKAQTHIEAVADRNIGWVNAGFTALGVFAAMLALGGVGITYFSTQSYREQIRNKKESLERYEKEIKELLLKARNNATQLSDLLCQQGVSEKFSQNTLKQAQEAVQSGKGMEILWGKAILAQEKEEWEKAYTFWKAILEDYPKNSNALFGLSYACYSLSRLPSKSKEEKRLLLKEGIDSLKNIPYRGADPTVLQSWGLLLMECAVSVSTLEEKISLWNEANSKFQRAVGIDPQLAQVWSNWGNLFCDRAAATTSLEKKILLWDEANSKYQRAVGIDPQLASAWSNWGTLLSDRAAATTSLEVKIPLWNEAESKYQRAVEINPQFAKAWFNWGSLFLQRAEAVTSRTEKNTFWVEAEKKYAQCAAIIPALPAYRQACLVALRHFSIENVLHYLNISLEGKELPSVRDILNNPDFASVHDTPEFKAFIEQVRALHRPIDQE